MNSSVRNIMRKEYREIMPVWLALLIAGPVCWLVYKVVTLLSINTSLNDQVPYLTGTAVIVLVYTIVVSSQSFVREIEAGSYSALRRFPVSCRTVVIGKCLANTVSIVALTLALGLMAGLLSLIFRDGQNENILHVFGRYLLPVAEALCIGFFVSARCRHEYTALLLTLLSIFFWDTISQYCTVFACEHFFHFQLDTINLESCVPVMTGKLLALLIFIPGICYTDRWFKIQDEYRPCGRTLKRNHPSSSEMIPESRPAAGEFAGLLWLGWRQSRVKIIVPFIFVLGVFLFMFVDLFWYQGSNWKQLQKFPIWIVPLWILYTLFMSLEIFHADMWQKDSVLTTRFQVTPWKFWLSRLLLFIGPVVLISLVAMVLMYFTIMMKSMNNNDGSWSNILVEQSAMWKSFWIGDLLFTQQGGYLHEIIYWYLLMMVLFFIMSIIVFTASFCRRRIMIVAMALILSLVLLMFTVIKEMSFEYTGNIVLFFWLGLAFFFLSYRLTARRLRSRPLHPFGVAFFLSIVLPVIVTSIWSVEWETLTLPQRKAVFAKEAILSDKPFDINNPEDAEAIRLRENISIAFYHRVYQTFVYTSEDGNRTPPQLVRDLDRLEEGWEKYLQLFRYSKNACGPYSSEIEWIIVRSIYEYCDKYTSEEIEQASALLAKIPQTRPDGVEQERRKYRFYVRLLMTGVCQRDPHGDDYQFYIEESRWKNWYQKQLWNEFQSRALVAKIRDEYYRNDNSVSLDYFLYEQDRLLQTNSLTNSNPCCIISPYGRYWPMQTETLRRMLLIQIAVLRYYKEYNKYPDSWKELTALGFLDKFPSILILGGNYILPEPFDPDSEEGKKIVRRIAPKDQITAKRARYIVNTNNIREPSRWNSYLKMYRSFGAYFRDKGLRFGFGENILGSRWNFSEQPFICDPYFRVTIDLKKPKGEDHESGK